MSKPLHPSGIHLLKLINVNRSKFGPLLAQCIFEGTGANKGCYTLSRLISRHGRFSETSQPFLDQLLGLNSDKDLASEISRFCGQEFLCVIPKQGRGPQMNISQFLEPSHINSDLHVEYSSFTSESQVTDV